MLARAALAAVLAACGVVVCQLYWELWHEKAPELHIEIYELSDGRNIVNEVER